ncbi:MAG: HAD family hydrolase [Gemmatimonadales bacterium]
MPTALRAVLFDLDGTLVDSIALIVDAMHHAFEGFDGPRPTDAEWMLGIGTPLWLQLSEYGRDEAEVTKLRDRYRAYQLLHHDRYIRSYPGVPETLAVLASRGLALAIVTSKLDQLARRNLGYLDLLKYFPLVVGVEATTKHKPEPEPVLFALEKLGVAPDQAVFVGDSPHDVGAGNAAGVATIAALWGPFTRDQLTPAGPRHWLSDIRALPGLLDAI